MLRIEFLVANLYKFKNYGAKNHYKMYWQRLSGLWSEQVVKKIEKLQERVKEADDLSS